MLHKALCVTIVWVYQTDTHWTQILATDNSEVCGLLAEVTPPHGPL